MLPYPQAENICMCMLINDFADKDQRITTTNTEKRMANVTFEKETVMSLDLTDLKSIFQPIQIAQNPHTQIYSAQLCIYTHTYIYSYVVYAHVRLCMGINVFRANVKANCQFGFFARGNLRHKSWKRKGKTVGNVKFYQQTFRYFNVTWK